MKILSLVFVGLVMLEHVYILVLEMFLWTSRGPKVFGITKKFAEETQTLAANQGLYNGFLAAGLLWTFFIQDQKWAFQIRVFFLLCVIVAGIYGGLTANKRIIFVQGVPAMIALGLLWLAKDKFIA
ncbi:MAG: DUF1304 domain-containing protein [Spirochaetota bacterium]